MTVFPVSLHLFPNRDGFDFELTLNDESSVVSDEDFQTVGEAFDEAYKEIQKCLDKGLLTAGVERHVAKDRIEPWIHLDMELTISLSKQGDG